MNLREKLLSFANAYSAEMDHTGIDDDELRSINHPIVFVFLGDQSVEALEAVHALNSTKWNNSAGVVYLHIGTKAPAARITYMAGAYRPRQRTSAVSVLRSTSSFMLMNRSRLN